MPNYKIATQRQGDYDADIKRVSDGLDSLNKAVASITRQLGTIGRGATGTTVTRIMGGSSSNPSSNAGVTYLNISVPSRQNVTGGPVLNSGTIVIGDNAQSAGFAFIGPTTGTTAIPTFRRLVATDIPTLSPLAWTFTSATTNVTMGVATGYIRVQMDATTANRSVVLPPVTSVIGLPISISKTDSSINIVAAIAAGTDTLNIPLGMGTLATQWDVLSLLATSAGWEAF